MNRLRGSFKRKKIIETTLPVLVLFLLTLIIYGPLINRLGYYNEDWYHLLFIAKEGPKSLISLYSIDRPFMGWLNYFDYLMIGDNLLAWNIYALVCRFFVGLGAFWLMKLIWPKQRFAGFSVALIVLMYPGFLSQPHAMNYKNYLFEYAFALFSIALTVKWVVEQKKTLKVVYAVLSILLAGAYILIYEFMIGLEATRILLLAYLFWREKEGQWKSVLISTLKYSAAYVLVWGGFVYWRLFVFQASRVAVSEGAVLSQFTDNPVRTLLRIGLETGKDLIESVFFAWAVPSYELIGRAYYSELGQASIFVALAVGLLAVYFWLTGKTETGSETSLTLSKTFILLGILSATFSLLTIVIPGRDIKFNGFERYSLHATLGIALLIVGVLLTLPRKYSIVILVFMAALSTTTHYLNANRWMKNWQGQKEVWWQVSWRIPQIKGGTLVIVDYPPSSWVEQDYEIFAPLNLIYDDVNPLILAEVLNNSTITLIERGADVGDMLRNVPLAKDFSSILTLSVPSEYSCLHVMDKGKLELSEFEDLRTKIAASYSKIDQIDLGGTFHLPPRSIFGPEPEHRWCYYYQKASIARQLGDWDEVIRLFDEAAQKGYKARDKIEWMPFFEAYANLGMLAEAKELASVIRSSRIAVAQLCLNLPQDSWYSADYDYQTVHKILCQ